MEGAGTQREWPTSKDPSLVVFDSLGWKANPLLQRQGFSSVKTDHRDAGVFGIEPGLLELIKRLWLE
jgi:hypothetical protein